MIDELVSRFGYAAILVGAFVEGELVLLAAGALVQSGRLAFLPVVLAGATGSFIWGQVWFHLGRSTGSTVLQPRPAWRARAERVKRWLASSGLLVLLGGRFVAGMGTILPAMVGASGYSRRRFTLFDSLGALIWTTAFCSAGLGICAGMLRVAQRSPHWVMLVVGGALGVLVWFLARRRNVQRDLPMPAEQRAPARKQLIVTGDDFGIAVAVNEAIELGHRDGILTTTSLLVGEPAAADAVARARINPELRVGLHLALCEGVSSLPAREIPLLTNRRGELYGPVTAILLFFVLGMSKTFKSQLEVEIRAQFAAFRATGLAFDHVNGHNNMQLHPTVLPILIRVAREFGVQAIRIPYEPPLAAWRAARTAFFRRLGVWAVMGSWTRYVKGRLVREGFLVNDYLFGVFDCGGMTRDLLRAVILNLPDGLSEIHCHPAARRCPELDKIAPRYAHEAELAALVDVTQKDALRLGEIELLAGFGAALTARKSGVPVI